MENFTLILTLLIVSTTVFSAPLSYDTSRAVDYLKKYNYLQSSEMEGSNATSTEVTKEGLRRFQRFSKLPVTGELDEATMELMNKPRCGLPDVQATHSRKRRFVVSSFRTKWPKTSLTWRIDNFTSDIQQADITKTIKDALQYWSDVSRLTFTQVSKDKYANIIISFVTFDHGDGHKFDGPGETLAHGFFPGTIREGEAHFDDSENFTLTENGYNLKWIAVHEFGHCLGLNHSDINETVMWPHYNYKPNFTLQADDIAGIRYLYGENTRESKVITSHNGSCNGRVDTITRTLDGETYVFRDNYVFKLGVWTKISDTFPGLPNNLDASLYLSNSNHTYFFKGDQYYKYTGAPLEKEYPKLISTGWPGVPNDLDAAFIWSGDIYFIKGQKYYLYNGTYGSVQDGYPKPLSDWNGLPTKVDSALLWTNNETYFFSGEEYYRYEENLTRIDNGYPRPTIEYWIECEPKHSTGIAYVLVLILFAFCSLVFLLFLTKLIIKWRRNGRKKHLHQFAPLII